MALRIDRLLRHERLRETAIDIDIMFARIESGNEGYLPSVKLGRKRKMSDLFMSSPLWYWYDSALSTSISIADFFPPKSRSALSIADFFPPNWRVDCHLPPDTSHHGVRRRRHRQAKPQITSVHRHLRVVKISYLMTRYEVIRQH